MEPSFNQFSDSTLPPDPAADSGTPAAPLGSNFTRLRFGPEKCYEFEHCVGQGGMGEIWAAAHHLSDRSRRVAVKIIRPDRRSVYAGELFDREIVMHARVGDIPGVVRLIDHGSFEHYSSDAPIRYIIMEWIDEARPLSEYCATLAWNKAVGLFAEVSAIVAAVHARGIIHCDIKPNNVLVNGAGRPFITDFGLAIATDGPGSESYGREINAVRGTWMYMAPEQAIETCDPKHFTPALDVYALGVTFYESLTGHSPYAIKPEQMDGSPDARAAIAAGAKIARRIDGRTLPAPLYKLFSSACNPLAAARPRHAGEITPALRGMAATTRLRETGTFVTLLALVWLFATYVAFPAVMNTELDTIYFRSFDVKPLQVTRLACRRIVVTDDHISAVAATLPPGAQGYARRLATAEVLEALAAGKVSSVGLTFALSASPRPDRSAAQSQSRSNEAENAIDWINSRILRAIHQITHVFVATNTAFCAPNELLENRTGPDPDLAINPEHLGVADCRDAMPGAITVLGVSDGRGRLVPSIALQAAAAAASPGKRPRLRHNPDTGAIQVDLYVDKDAATPSETVTFEGLPAGRYKDILPTAILPNVEKSSHCLEELDKVATFFHIAGVPTSSALEESTKRSDEIIAWSPARIAEYCRGDPVLIGFENPQYDPPVSTQVPGQSFSSSALLQITAHVLMQKFIPAFRSGAAPILRRVSELSDRWCVILVSTLSILVTRAYIGGNRSRRGLFKGVIAGRPVRWPRYFVVFIPSFLLVLLLISLGLYQFFTLYWNFMHAAAAGVFAAGLASLAPWWYR